MKNRVVMAPMTRSRADSHGVAGPLMREYYKQRASMGLIITEGMNISSQAIGVPSTSGIYTDAQIASWRKFTDAVHNSGGAIFAQLWQTGRVGHSSWRNGALPGPSAIRIERQKPFTAGGIVDYVPYWPKDVLGTYARIFDGPINAGYTPDEAEEALLRGDADLISFGMLALADPDLHARIASRGPFNEADRNTLYAGGSERGYTDYPALQNR